MTTLSGTGLTCLRGERIVFRDLSFNVAEGESLCLRGSNGSGKSTLLRLMAGLLKPMDGQIRWNRENVANDWDEYHALIHYVGHKDAIKTALSVRENLQFWADMRQIDAEKQTIDKALETFAISHLAHLPARYLSAGQSRRLNLARLTATPAPIWLLDEPTTSLDANSVDALKVAIAAHRQKGGLVIMATHDATPNDAAVLDVSQFADKGEAE